MFQWKWVRGPEPRNLSAIFWSTIPKQHKNLSRDLKGHPEPHIILKVRKLSTMGSRIQTTEKEGVDPGLGEALNSTTLRPVSAWLSGPGLPGHLLWGRTGKAEYPEHEYCKNCCDGGGYNDKFCPRQTSSLSGFWTGRRLWPMKGGWTERNKGWKKTQHTWQPSWEPDWTKGNSFFSTSLEHLLFSLIILLYYLFGCVRF